MSRIPIAAAFLALLLPVGSVFPQDKVVVLFDLEQGIQGWWGNAWGGGKCTVQPAASAKYGAGALKGVYTEVAKGANVVSPNLAADAPWRKGSWGGVSFWLKGDGSPGRLSLHLDTSQPGSTGFTAQVPLESKEWKRFGITEFWSREGLAPDFRKLKRLMFGCTGTHSFEVDQISLQAPHRELPLDSEKVVVCPRCAKPPVLDGNLDDECWKSAAVLSPFVTNDFGKPAKDQTEVRLCWDSQHLYIGATMRAADPSRLKATLTRRDSYVYTDDCIELFLDPEDAQKSWYQLDTNPLATLMDIASTGGMAWDGDWQAKCQISRNGWTAEAVISLSSFGKTPAVGDTWGFNVGREAPATKEITCWSCTGGKFHTLNRWGHLVFTNALAPLPIGYEFSEYSFGDYGVVCDLQPFADKDADVRVRLTNALGDMFANTALVTPSAARDREVLVPVRAAFKEQGEAKFSFVVVTGGNVVTARAGRFIVFPPATPRPKPFISLLPTPKKLLRGEGSFLLPRDAEVSCVGLLPEDRNRCLGLLTSEVKQYYGLDLRQEHSDHPTISLVCVANAKALPAERLPMEAQREYDSLPPEGYVLQITPTDVTIAAKDPHGVFYGIQTLFQAIAQTTAVPGEPKAPAMTVVDYPSLRIRAASIPIPCDRWGHPNDAYVSPEFFCDFLARTLVRWKYNTLILIVGNGMKFDSHPECSGPAAWTKDEVRRVLDFCRRNYIEVVPLQTVLAHANWFTLAHKDLWEDGEYHIACVSNPATQKLLCEVYDEIIDVFKPKFMHIGMDEAWWKTLDTPPEKRCKLCAGKPKWQIVADQATRFRDYLASKGIRAMMWGDMLLEEHNGGAPYHSAKALGLIPRDIIIGNWSTSLAPASSKRFKDAGHEVIQSNSIGVNREQADWVIGNMMGIWMKNAWLTDTNFRGAQGFSFLSLVNASEFSWNMCEDVVDPMKRIRRDVLEDVADAALRRLALRPEPAASGRQFSVPISAICNFSRTAGTPPSRANWFNMGREDDLHDLPQVVTLAGVTFNILPATAPQNAIAPWPAPVIIPIHDRVAGLYFLQGCHLDEKDREPFLKRFQKKDSMMGIKVGGYRIRYEDRTEAEMDMRYAWNVMPWRMRENVLPYCYASPAVLTFATEGMKRRDPRGVDVQLHVAQWANDHPEKTVLSVEFSSADTEAVPFLLAVTAKAAK